MLISLRKNLNLSVALVGRNERVGCATLAAGAMLNLWSEITPGQFENEVLAKRFNLTRQGVESWGDFAAELNEEPIFSKIFAVHRLKIIPITTSTNLLNGLA